MPEAPWIRRWKNGIKFTDDMQEEDIDINTNDRHHHEPAPQKENAYEQEPHLSARKKHLSE